MGWRSLSPNHSNEWSRLTLQGASTDPQNGSENSSLGKPVFLVPVLLETPSRTLNIRAKMQTEIPDSHYENPPTILLLGRWCMEAAFVQAVVSWCYAPSFYKFSFIHLYFPFLSKLRTNSTLLVWKRRNIHAKELIFGGGSVSQHVYPPAVTEAWRLTPTWGPEEVHSSWGTKTFPNADMFLTSEAHFIQDSDFNRNPASISGGAVSEKHNGRVCFKPFSFFFFFLSDEP